VLFALSYATVAQPTQVTRLPSPSSESNGSSNRETPRSEPKSFDEIIDRLVEREHLLLARMVGFRPIMETYLQNLQSDSRGNIGPLNDQYFVGHLSTGHGPKGVSFIWQEEPGVSRLRRSLKKLADLYAIHFEPLGFANMVVPDTDFSKVNYSFSLVRREFLGDVRCLVIDVQPKPDGPSGRFQGRIWVEDRDYNIVRFNGTYSRPPSNSFYLHFDSWRLNLQPGMWLPAYVYMEEANVETPAGRIHLKAQTRLWGYDLKRRALSQPDEFTKIVVDSQQPIEDRTDSSEDTTSLSAERLWEHQAETNVIDRLQQSGLLAPPGEVNKVLQTVVNNLLISNHIDLPFDVRCRVLLTVPLESVTIGHTIVISRGLLDVLPDEASLGMILAHELSHILLGHSSDTRFAFYDRMFLPDSQWLRRIKSKRSPTDEQAADTKALELLENSPYKEKLASTGLFLKALLDRAPNLLNLISAHLGNSLATGQNIRMSALLAAAPKFDEHKLDQIAALPLGGRIKLDPWSDKVEMAKAPPAILVTFHDRMPFEITPLFPHLIRISDEIGTQVTSVQGGSQ
jgi:hypothetical protein